LYLGEPWKDRKRPTDLSVRPLIEADIPQVADLCWNIMRGEKGPAPPTLSVFLKELYFTSPWIDREIPSLVYDDKEQKIVGFLGVVPRRMSLGGEPIRVAFGGNFVVRPDARNSLAGMHLLATYMKGAQDLSQTDSANDVARTLLERLGFRMIIPLSIHWSRPLRPARYIVDAVSRATGPLTHGALTMVTKPFSIAADGLAKRLPINPFRVVKPPTGASALDIETHLECMSKFRAGYSLWPDYDSDSLRWLLGMMERVPSHGRLRKMLVRDKQKILGWFLYYVKPGGVGRVLQVCGERQSMQLVLDHLFYDALSEGVVGLHGVMQGRFLPDFSAKNCIVSCRKSWTVAHSRRPELLDLMERGEANLTALDGESCFGLGT
jgi:hypothetical protein